MYHAFVNYDGKILYITKTQTALYNWIWDNPTVRVSGLGGIACHGMHEILEEINTRHLGIKPWTKEDVIEFYYTGHILIHQTKKAQKAYVSYLIKKHKSVEKQTKEDKKYVQMFEKYYHG